jgi:transposase-like protein
LVVLTAHLSNPPYPFRRLCEEDIQGLIGRKAGKATPPPVKAVAGPPIQRRLTPEQVTELGEAYQAGSTVRQLAGRLGINRTTVSEHLERLGIPRRANQRKLSNQLVAEAKQLYESGQSLAALGARFDVHSETVRWS